MKLTIMSGHNYSVVGNQVRRTAMEDAIYSNLRSLKKKLEHTFMPQISDWYDFDSSGNEGVTLHGVGMDTVTNPGCIWSQFRRINERKYTSTGMQRHSWRKKGTQQRNTIILTSRPLTSLWCCSLVFSKTSWVFFSLCRRASMSLSPCHKARWRFFPSLVRSSCFCFPSLICRFLEFMYLFRSFLNPSRSPCTSSLWPCRSILEVKCDWE